LDHDSMGPAVVIVGGDGASREDRRQVLRQAELDDTVADPGTDPDNVDHPVGKVIEAFSRR
jgi:hypothetical protein